MDLNEVREAINRLDRKVAEIIAKRLDLTIHVFNGKKSAGLPTVNLEREKQVKDSMYNDLKSLGYDDRKFSDSLSELIIKKATKIQEEMKKEIKTNNP